VHDELRKVICIDRGTARNFTPGLIPCSRSA
jgi:hypothetical protein